MSRAILILANDTVRARARQWIDKAPQGTRVEFREQKRSLEQNSLLWAALTDVAKQKEHAGRKWSAEAWKLLFMNAIGREMQFVPALDGKSFFPMGYRSSELSKAEMSDLIEFMFSWGAENGVVFHDDKSTLTRLKEAADKGQGEVTT